MKLGTSKLIKVAACGRLCSDCKSPLANFTKSSGSRELKQVRHTVLNATNAFLANIKNSTHGFKLRVDASRLSSLWSMKGLFRDNGIIEMLKTVDMKRIDYVSPFSGLIFDRYCSEEYTAPVPKASSAFVGLLLVLRNKHDVGVYS